METKKRALGRGLEQLFDNNDLDIDNVKTVETRIYEQSTNEEIVELPLEELRVNPYQPRKVFNEQALDDLTNSIKEHGVFQPIIVKKSIKGFEIIAGERRVRASKRAGKTSVPAIIRDFTDAQMMEIALLENLQRENLNAIEEATAYVLLLKKLNLTQDELSKKVGKSRSYITNIVGILRLPSEVKELVTDGKISMSHAKILSKMENPEQIKEIAHKITDEGMAVRDLESLVDNKEIPRKIKIEKIPKSNEYKYVEDMMKDKLDTKVKISDKKIEISFVNVADLNRILEIIDIKE